MIYLPYPLVKDSNLSTGPVDVGIFSATVRLNDHRKLANELQLISQELDEFICKRAGCSYRVGSTIRAVPFIGLSARWRS